MTTHDDTVRHRVALVAHRLSTGHASGIDRYVRELVVGLSRLQSRPFDVVVASAPEPTAPTWIPTDIDIRRLGAPRRALHLAWTAAGRPRVDRWVGPVELVHALSAAVPVPSRAPVLYTVHDLSPLEAPEFFAAHERWGFNRAVADAARRATRIVCDSSYVAGQFVERYDVSPARVAVIPLGVGHRFREAVPDRARDDVRRLLDLPERYFLFVGEVNTRKNLTPLLQGLAKSRAAPLVIAGGQGRGADEVSAAVARLGLADVVRYAGYVEDVALPALMAGALALVHPGAHEGFGFTPLESMAVGTPAIVAAGGSLPELVGDAALQVAPADVDGWAAALDRMAGDVQLRETLVTAGRTRASAYTWERTAAATASLYDECLRS
jgi:glycosyltransferase involved in cell wall biosynthesis